MKNRDFILNELIKMSEKNISIDEMINKLKHYNMSYYESLNMLNEVMKKSLNEISDCLLKDDYWKIQKEKTDSYSEIVNKEYLSIMEVTKEKRNNLSQNIEESYKEILNQRKEKEKKLLNLDKVLTELFQH